MSNIKKSPAVKGKMIHGKDLKNLFSDLYELQERHRSFENLPNFKSYPIYWSTLDKLIMFEKILYKRLGLNEEYLAYMMERSSIENKEKINL